MIAAAVLAAALSACGGKEKANISLTAEGSRMYLEMSGSGDFKIDWGDGSKREKGTFSYKKSEFGHDYSDKSAHTVSITGGYITYFYCNRELQSLDVSNNTALKELHCDGTKLTDLDVSSNIALTELRCENNQLTSLDLSKNTALEKLRCGNNKLTDLDLSKNTALIYLECDKNQLTNLDVSKNTALQELYCSYNQLTGLDVSKNTSLKFLYCHYNQITGLDVSHNNALLDIHANNNQMSVAALNDLFRSLPRKTADRRPIHIYDNPGAKGCNGMIAFDRRWLVYERDWR
jgi:hypothetical protein